MSTLTPEPTPAAATPLPTTTLDAPSDGRRELATTLVQSASGTRPSVEIDLPQLELAHSPDGATADLHVIAPLGAGGSGSVFLARQGSLDRLVAVKLLRDEPRDGGASLVLEARVAARVEHPNVVPVYHLGKTATGAPVLVMKNIRGVSWLDLAKNPANALWARLAPHRRERLLVHLEILLAVCNAVAAAHREGILHRDVKPSNVMVAGPGEVYLMDWGIAVDRSVMSRGAATSIVGTPAYMPPEMLSGDPRDLDERADVFMLGASLHYILTGEFRNQGATNADAFAALRALGPYAYGHGVPDELAAICNRATAADRERRFDSVEALREAVQTFIDHHGAFKLTEAARDIVDALEAAPRHDPTAAARADEARLVLHGALAEWPENPLARAELERLRRVQVEIELAGKHAAAARAHLAAMTAPPPALALAVGALEAEERGRAERETRDAALAHDLDLRTAQRTRRWFFSLLIVYGLGLGSVFVALRLGRGEDVTGGRQIGFAAVTTTFYLVMLIVTRRELLVNRVNRSIMGIVGSTFAFNLVHRVVGWSAHADPRFTLTIDTLAMGVIVGIGALMISPRLWIVSALCAGGVVVQTLAPAAAAGVFGACAFVMLVMMSREWGGTLGERG